VTFDGFTGFRIEHIQPIGAASGPAERPIATEGGAA